MAYSNSIQINKTHCSRVPQYVQHAALQDSECTAQHFQSYLLALYAAPQGLCRDSARTKACCQEIRHEVSKQDHVRDTSARGVYQSHCLNEQRRALAHIQPRKTVVRSPSSAL
jgi:hypothetical protein